jgi:uncharacterized protein YaaQ
MPTRKRIRSKRRFLREARASVERVLTLRAEGFSVPVIASSTGFTKEGVTEILKRAEQVRIGNDQPEGEA